MQHRSTAWRPRTVIATPAAAAIRADVADQLADNRPRQRPAAGRLRTDSRCRIQPYIDQGGACGAAGAPVPGSALGRPPGTARRVEHLDLVLDQSSSFPNGTGWSSQSSSAPIVQLAGTASRPPSGCRFAVVSPAWTRHPLARIRRPLGRRGQSRHPLAGLMGAANLCRRPGTYQGDGEGRPGGSAGSSLSASSGCGWRLACQVPRG